MPVYEIHDLLDARLEPFRALPKSQLAKQGGFFITEGDTVTQRLFGSRCQAKSVLLEASFLPTYEALAPTDVDLFVVSHELMLETVGFPFHRGVMGCAVRPRLPPPSQVIPSSPAACLLAILPETQDPTNLGAMLRTCAAFGVDAVLLGDACADVFSRRVVRVSMGAVMQLPLAFLPYPHESLPRLAREHDVELWATVLDPTAEPLTSVRRGNRAGIVFGSEGHGLRPEWIAACQRRVTIPMDARVDSLNASVAAGIFLYYFSGSGKGS